MLANKVRMCAPNVMRVGELPGSVTLLAGNKEAGFYGEVQARELITGDALANSLGIVEGVSINSDKPWFKFSVEGKTIFVSKRAYRRGVSWDHLNEVGCVYGEKTLSIKDIEYKVRLLAGGKDTPESRSGSEWNRLILPLSLRAKTQDWKYKSWVPEPTAYWDLDYTDEELNFRESGRNPYAYCQEQITEYQVTTRGSLSLSHGQGTGKSQSYSDRLWRPVLEVIK